MNKMTGIILMVIGAILLVSGIIIFSKYKDSSPSEISSHESTTTSQPEPIRQDWSDNNEDPKEQNKRKGDEFEKYVIQKFDQKYFKVKEWASDKYVNGIYPETTLQPDMILEFQLKENRKQLAVECKWRKDLFKNGIEVLSEAQLSRYKRFEAEKNIPVFIAVGLGGNAGSPKDLFIIPLRELDSKFVYMNTLKKFRKDKSEDFFFDLKTAELR